MSFCYFPAPTNKTWPWIIVFTIHALRINIANPVWVHGHQLTLGESGTAWEAIHILYIFFFIRIQVFTSPHLSGFDMTRATVAHFRLSEVFLGELNSCKKWLQGYPGNLLEEFWHLGWRAVKACLRCKLPGEESAALCWPFYVSHVCVWITNIVVIIFFFLIWAINHEVSGWLYGLLK